VGQSNFVAQLNSYNKGESDNLNGNLNLKYTVLKGLDIRGSLGYNKIEGKQISVYPSSSYDPNITKTGNSIFGNQTTKTLLFEPQVLYATGINKMKIDLLLGSTIQAVNTKGQAIYVNNYNNDLLLESSSYGTTFISPSNSEGYRYLSFFGRATLNWNNRYIINGNLRSDGSSRFGLNKQFGTFGSIAAAWLFSNETFVEDHIEWLSYGKLRSSYGTTGNDAIGNYGYLSLYSSGPIYGSTITISPSQVGNSDYRWEVNKKFEIAIDLGLFQDKLLLSGSWYSNKSGNQLVGFPLAATTGFNSYQANLPATVQNQGYELQLATTNIQSSEFSWSTSLNFTSSRNKLSRFDGIEKTAYAASYIIGQPLNNVQLFRFIGLNPQTGLPNFEDMDGNGLNYQSAYNGLGGDYVNIGTTDPKWFGGITNSVRYKSFQLDALMQYTRQNGYNMNANYFGDLHNTVTENLAYWKMPNDPAIIPKPVGEYGDYSGYDYSYVSSGAFSDASFFRLKNVSLSYTLPEAIFKKLRLSGLKFYCQGQNLWTVSPYKGYDPENASSRLFNIPALRSIIAGIQCSL
jgi:TonB-linked SusC/RagA family outer membrane protein